MLSCSIEKADDISKIKRNQDFNNNWLFQRIENQPDEKFETYYYNHSEWEEVSLPHTARIEPLIVNDQWQGIAWYRKEFLADRNDSGNRFYIEFEAAMQVADVWINGTHLTTHKGGYLPFTIDITDHINFDKKNILAVKLDNRDNPQVPPGKPLNTLDFCYYGGIYRNVKLHIVNELHISDAVFANQKAGGGIFINYKDVTSEKAEFVVKTHVVNLSGSEKTFTVKSEVVDPSGKIVLTMESEKNLISQNSDKHIIHNFTLENPQLWDIDTPNLYTVNSYILSAGELVDFIATKTGMRSISFSAKDGFTINGNKRFLRGTNRHQEYPYIGNALSDEAQFRDAFKIKQAGFDYIRLSHYPQSPAFMRACDELGLVVMNCIPGWQFMGDSMFKELCYQNIRDMIRSDRNHPGIVLWETSLNESWMQDDFINTSQQITHEELPGKYTYSCGWQKGFDVFIQARQHGGLKDYNDPLKGAVISEYGDWEYYAQNAGLDQPGFKNLLKEERNSRQLRSAGEKRLLQQAMNFQEAHNDNQKTIAAGDGLWVMFDYNRGYDTTLEASGPMDIFRLPKFAYYFYQSQRDALPRLKQVESGPMVFIANYWMQKSTTDVRVFSNCDQLELYLNETLIERRNPDENKFSTHLQHPPFTFKLKEFVAGELLAVGFIDDKEAARHTIKTPERPYRIEMEFDYSGKPINREKRDVIFVYAKIVDINGTVIPDFNSEVQFTVEGPAELIGHNPIKAEAGIAAILLKNKIDAGAIEVSALAQSNGIRLSGKNSIR
jgi:beta-galactosidase